jgi:hypothetical protein
MLSSLSADILVMGLHNTIVGAIRNVPSLKYEFYRRENARLFKVAHQRNNLRANTSVGYASSNCEILLFRKQGNVSLFSTDFDSRSKASFLKIAQYWYTTIAACIYSIAAWIYNIAACI